MGGGGGISGGVFSGEGGGVGFRPKGVLLHPASTRRVSVEADVAISVRAWLIPYTS